MKHEMTKNTTFEIGENIKRLREFRGYSQQYMADQLDISQKTYSSIESDAGKVNKAQIKHIASILDIDPAHLLTYDARYVFNNENCNQAWMFTVENYNEASMIEKDLYEKRINEQKELFEKRIDELKGEVEYLRKIIDRLSK